MLLDRPAVYLAGEISPSPRCAALFQRLHHRRRFLHLLLLLLLRPLRVDQLSSITVPVVPGWATWTKRLADTHRGERTFATRRERCARAALAVELEHCGNSLLSPAM